MILAVSTLAIVGVLFSLYQYTTSRNENTTRTDSTPGGSLVRGVAPIPGSPDSAESTDQPQGVNIGQGKIGSGQFIRVAFYTPHSDVARGEITCTDWRASPDSDREIEIDQADIRFRTPSGQLVRITADSGRVELLSSLSEGSTIIRGGRMSGHVTATIDRLTEAQREALPPSQRDRLDPSRVIELKFEEIEFFLDEMRVNAQGRFSLRMREAQLDGVGLRLRYNDVDSRVELLRFDRLEQLVIRQPREAFLSPMPGTGEVVVASNPPSKRPATARARTRAPNHVPGDADGDARDTPSSGGETEPHVTTDATLVAEPDSIIGEPTQPEDALPIFDPTRPKKKEFPTQTYLAELTEFVHVRQVVDDETAWELDADKLSLLFDFGAKQRFEAEQGRLPDEDASGAPTPTAAAEQENLDTIVVRCQGPFVLKPLRDQSPNVDHFGERVSIIATGRRVRFSDGLSVVSCATLQIDKHTGRVTVSGDDQRDVTIDSGQEAYLSAAALRIDRSRATARIDGPARLVSGRPIRTGGGASTAVAPDRPDSPLDRAAALSLDPSSGDVAFDLRFDDHADLSLAEAIVSRIDDATGQPKLVKAEYIDSAEFFGNVQVRQRNDLVSAAYVEITFDPPQGRGGFGRSIHSLTAQDRVTMQRGAENMSCDALTVYFMRDPTGAVLPQSAEAVGHVFITQESRTITADDHVTMRIAPLVKPKPPFDLVAARLAAMEKGLDPAEIDWDQVRNDYERRVEYMPGIKSIVAAGDVTAHDDTQRLDLTAETLECDFDDEQRLRGARIIGPEARDAFVQMGEQSVRAHEIEADLQQQRIEVVGRGALSLVTRRGLDGSKTDEPQQVSIRWTREMAFRGAENSARFKGDVHAASVRRIALDPSWLDRFRMTRRRISRETATFDCQELVIDFAETHKDPTEKAADSWWILSPVVEAISAGSGRSSRGVGREPVYVLASQGVVGLFAKVDDASGRLTSRVRIESENKLAIDVRSELLTIPGPGNLLVEDYPVGRERSPAPARTPASVDREPPSAARGIALFPTARENVPSQSMIQWGASMSFHYGTSRADFRKGVLLIHRRGQKIAFAEQLVDESSPIDRGRKTRLECQSLVAEFGSSPADASSGRASRSADGVAGLNLGDIQQLDASGGVLLDDDLVTIQAHRIVKFPSSDLLRVFGSEAADAEFFGKRPGEPRFRGKEFNFNLATGDVELVGRHEIRIRR